MAHPRRSLSTYVLGVALVMSSASNASADDIARACVAEASRVGTPPTAPPTAPQVPVCFESLVAAVAFATGGAVRFPAGTSPDIVRVNLGDELARAAFADSETTIISIDYDFDFFDEQLIWKTTHTQGCLDGSAFFADTMPSGWDNKVDASESYQGCNLNDHWEHNNQTGSHVMCSCPSMGVMEDQTSSEEWEHSGGASTATAFACALDAATDPTSQVLTNPNEFIGTLTFGVTVGETNEFGCAVQLNSADPNSDDLVSRTGSNRSESVTFEASVGTTIYLCASYGGTPLGECVLAIELGEDGRWVHAVW